MSDIETTPIFDLDAPHASSPVLQPHGGATAGSDTPLSAAEETAAASSTIPDLLTPPAPSALAHGSVSHPTTTQPPSPPAASHSPPAAGSVSPAATSVSPAAASVPSLCNDDSKDAATSAVGGDGESIDAIDAIDDGDVTKAMDGTLIEMV